MPLTTDSNEVHSALKVWPDAGQLDEFIELIDGKVDKLQTPKNKPKQAGAVYVQETVHTHGGVQPPMTGPSGPLLRGTSTKEQADINEALLEEQREEGRLADAQVVTVQPALGGADVGDVNKAAREADPDAPEKGDAAKGAAAKGEAKGSAAKGEEAIAVTKVKKGHGR